MTVRALCNKCGKRLQEMIIVLNSDLCVKTMNST